MKKSQNLTNDIAAVVSLVEHCEEMIFKSALTEDLIDKYEEKRRKIFSQIGYSPESSFKKLRRELYLNRISDKKDTGVQVNLFLELEKMHKLKLSQFKQKLEGVKWETLQLHQNFSIQLKEYENFTQVVLLFIDNLTSSISMLAGVYTENKEPQSLSEENSIIFTQETKYEDLISDIKKEQKAVTKKFQKFKYEFSIKESNFQHFFSLIENEIRGKDRKLEDLQKVLQREYENWRNSSAAQKLKIKDMEERMVFMQEEFRKEVQKIEEIGKEKEEELKKQFLEECKAINAEKEVLCKKIKQSISDHETSQENLIGIINKLKENIQNINSEKNEIVEKNELLQVYVNELNDKISQNKNIILKNEEFIKNAEEENYQIKNYYRTQESSFRNQTETIENSYKFTVERIKKENSLTISQLEQKIIILQEEICDKNERIKEIYKKHSETTEALEKLTEKNNENEQNMKNAYEIIEDLKKHLQNINDLSKEYYFKIKLKPVLRSSDYFQELISCIPQLLTDKEWLIMKISELTEDYNKSSVYSINCSKTAIPKISLDRNFNSFKVLKEFQKSRSEIIKKFNIHD